MKNMIPFNKLSKKEQKRINKEKRNLWTVNPVTRKESKNKHKENKYKEQYKYNYSE